MTTIALMSASGMAAAHKASDSFLYLNSGPTELRMDVALRDLALLVSIDSNGDNDRIIRTSVWHRSYLDEISNSFVGDFRRHSAYSYCGAKTSLLQPARKSWS